MPGGWGIAVEMSFHLAFLLLAALRRGALALVGAALGSFVRVSVGAASLVQAATGEPLFVEPFFSRWPDAAAFWVATVVVIAVTALLGKASRLSFERWSIEAARRVAGRLR